MSFVGINIAMGLISLPTIMIIGPLISLLTLGFRTAKSRNCFCQLLHYVHVDDNTMALPQTAPNHDRLRKTRPLYYVLSKQSKDLYTPCCELKLMKV